MRPESEYIEVMSLVGAGLNDCEIARRTGVPRETVRGWRRTGRRGWPLRLVADSGCPICGDFRLDGPQYAYLLGLYLGDGCLSKHPRNVFRLRISLDARYPRIIEECGRAMAVVSGRTVGLTHAPGCMVVNAYWKHWPCVFPQHGPGRKQERTIQLAAWQREIARKHPGFVLRGLIHSDGCRILNRVHGTGYPRYHFRNNSSGIREIFCTACDDYGVHWTLPRPGLLSIARRADVARLDLAVGPKT